jgi:methionyl-tRNA formyltransferase
VRIAFFGTPEFAVPSLLALLGEGFDVAVVITQPDRPQGRSRSQLIPSAVKSVATREDLPLLQPEQPGTLEFFDALRSYQPDLGVVVAYGHILKAELLALPPLGMVNVHASLLPQMRGAAPIQHAILAGLEETGVTIMQLNEGLDTGPMLLRVPTPILGDETAGELSARLAELGALALVEALGLIASRSAHPEPQEEALATWAPKITHALAEISWRNTGESIARLIRAMDPHPGAWTTHRNKELKLFGPQPAEPLAIPEPSAPGTVLETDPALVVATANGALQVLDVQPAGRTRMAAHAWVRGRGVSVGEQFR